MSSWSDKRHRDPLPIDLKLEHILGLIKDHQVVICEAETGAGKTTRIGQALILANPDRQVIMTQTRRNACRWNCRRIASEMNCQVGQLVGYSLSGEERKMISAATRLELIVDQTLTNRIRYSGALPEGVLIVDEAHERTLSIDLLLGIIKEKLSQATKTHILVMSATIDTKKFSAFFGGAPIVQVQGRCFPVSMEVVPLLHGEHHTEAATRAACIVMQRFLQGLLYVPSKQPDEKAIVEKGTVLILLPGKEDIDSAKKVLLTQAKNNPRVQILTCHGQNSVEEQDLVQTATPDHTIRFLCCTEILRNAITVPETVGVIDSLQVKRRVTNDKGVSHLDKIPISKAEADQGKGRAGRIAPGFYMPVSFESEFERLEPWPQPAILREPLGQVALQVACLGRSIRKFNFIDAPPAAKVELALRRLKALGALAEDETITETGRLLSRFPLDPEQAKALQTAHQLGVLAEAVIVTAVLEMEELFYRESHRKIWAGESQSDFVAIVRAYREFKKMEKSLQHSRKASGKPLEEWCTGHGVKLKQMNLVEDKIRQILEDLASTTLKIEHPLKIDREFNEAALTKALASGKIDHLARKGYGNQFSGRLGEFKIANESACLAGNELVLVGGVRKIPTKNRHMTTHFLLADFAAPIKPAWLLEVAPHLCKSVRKADHRYDSVQDLVVQTEAITFQNDLELMHQVPSDHDSAARVFAGWFVSQHPDRLPQQIAVVLRSNAQREELARQLNKRAGYALFATFPSTTLVDYLVARLSGSRCLAAVKPEVLALPPLDRPLMQRVLEENPDTIRVIGEELQVEYRESLPPRIILPAQLTADNRWSALLANPMQQLPWQLPSRRAVEMEISLNPGMSFTLMLGGHGRIVLSKNLSGIDLSRVNLSRVELSKITYDATTKFPVDTCQSLPPDTLPHFLADSELENGAEFALALDRYTLAHPQSEGIAWCIAMQVIAHARARKSDHNLKALSTHALVNPTGLMRAITTVWSFFGNTETKVQEAIRKAIEALANQRG
ncbi:MAG: hypothetical protein LLG04_14500 [Parachlamydia sp.]|nr:hypothetical protein [Parachlamydia sp.]